MMKKILYIIMLSFAMVAQAQTKVEGEAIVGAGYGETAPYMTGVNLKIDANKFTIKPYFSWSF